MSSHPSRPVIMGEDENGHLVVQEAVCCDGENVLCAQGLAHAPWQSNGVAIRGGNPSNEVQNERGHQKRGSPIVSEGGGGWLGRSLCMREIWGAPPPDRHTGGAVVARQTSGHGVDFAGARRDSLAGFGMHMQAQGPSSCELPPPVLPKRCDEKVWYMQRRRRFSGGPRRRKRSSSSSTSSWRSPSDERASGPAGQRHSREPNKEDERQNEKKERLGFEGRRNFRAR